MFSPSNKPSNSSNTTNSPTAELGAGGKGGTPPGMAPTALPLSRFASIGGKGTAPDIPGKGPQMLSGLAEVPAPGCKYVCRCVCACVYVYVCKSERERERERGREGGRERERQRERE